VAPGRPRPPTDTAPGAEVVQLVRKRRFPLVGDSGGAEPAGELQVHGSGALIRWLLATDLVDEMTLVIVPVVVGQGMRLSPDTGPDIALDLVDSRADSKGVTIQVYRPTGRPQYAS
jgi:dihydrofolate reductase